MMLNGSLISVIVPIYNCEKYLKKCIYSILNQTYSNLEIILVDDGSQDSCPQICNEFSRLDDRIRVIHKENGGLSDARNAGLDIAHGGYIGFVDSDDYIASDMYEKLLAALLDNNADIAVCNYLYVDESYKPMLEKNLFFPVTNEKLDIEGYIKKLVGPSGWYFITAWNKLYRRDIFSGLRYPIGMQHEDEFLIHHLIFRCHYIICLNQILYYYVQRPDSIMGKRQKLKLMDYGEALIDRYHLAKEKGNELLKSDTVKKLSCKLEEWKEYGQHDTLCKKKYGEIRKNALFLLVEKDAWNEYSFPRKMYKKCCFIAPNIMRRISSMLKWGKVEQ